MRSRSRGGGRLRVYALVLVLAVTAPLIVGLATDAFSTATLSRQSSVDVVSDSQGPLGVEISQPATGTTSDYLGLTNQFDSDVSVTVTLADGSTSLGDLSVNGQTVGDSTSFSLSKDQSQRVQLAVACDDSLVGKTVSATIEASGSGISATLNRSATIESGCTPDSDGGGTVFAVNAGGAEYTAGDGTIYQADTAFTGGSAAGTGDAINGTTDDTLYQSERFGQFDYNVSVPDGEYQVTFKFAEIYWGGGGIGGGDGSRIFNVSAEGSQTITQLDIFSRVGHDTALDLTRTVTVSDGHLNLGFASSADQAKISAIRIEQVEQPIDGGGTAFAVNSGGGNYTAGDGTVYQADTYFTGGGTYGTGDPVSNTTDDQLYQSTREGIFSYNIPIENGDYTVTFKFIENFFTTDGSRVFDVSAEGTQVISNLDVHSRVGHDAALDITRRVSVSDGQLDITFGASSDQAKISAIRIDSGGSATTTTPGETTTMPTPTPTTTTTGDGGSTTTTATATPTSTTTPTPTTPTPTTTESPSGQQPYGGTARTLPGRIEAENFDTGGEGVAYHDTTPGNENGNVGYRTSDVDIEQLGTSNYNVGYIETGEWLEYTIDIPSETTCTFRARVSAIGNGGSFGVSVDGTSTANLGFSSTGSYGTYQTFSAGSVSLSAGQHVLRVTTERSEYNIDWIECV